MLIQSVERLIEEKKIIVPGENVLVGVSGGHDSMALLHILYEISKKKGYNIYIAHVNHGVRGEDSDRDEAYVKSFAQKLGVGFFSCKVDMDEYARKNKLSPEEAGRELRYSFFRKVVKNSLNGGKIAVAHNRNDQAETVIMRVMRGTGIDGLAGMDYLAKDIIRPLLDISRAEIELHCEKYSLNPQIDKTNYENVYSRNKVRLELIPYIESNFNSNIINSLSRMSKIAKRDSDYLKELSIKAYSDILIKETEQSIEIDNLKFREIDQAIRYRVLRHAVENLKGDLNGLSESHLESIVELSNRASTGKSINIVDSMVAKLDYDKLSLERSEKKDKIGYNYVVKIEEATYIPEVKVSVLAKVVRIEDIDLYEKSKWKKYFDYDTVKKDITIRNRMIGDKIQLLGMTGRKKLKDYFIDEKIPKDDRDRIPMVDIDGEIAWIVGHRRSEHFKVTSNTKRVLVLEFKKE